MKRTTQMKNAGTPSARDAQPRALKPHRENEFVGISTLRSLYGRRPTAKYTRRANKRSRRRGFDGSLHEFMFHQLVAINAAKKRLAEKAKLEAAA